MATFAGVSRAGQLRNPMPQNAGGGAEWRRAADKCRVPTRVRSVPGTAYTFSHRVIRVGSTVYHRWVTPTVKVSCLPAWAHVEIRWVLDGPKLGGLGRIGNGKGGGVGFSFCSPGVDVLAHITPLVLVV